MAQLAVSPYSESQRMELRTLIRLASEVVSYYWPMRTFVHHNPLHGLEYLPFEKALQEGEKILGGRGYLAGAIFRHYVRAGRILPRHLDGVLKTLAQSRQIKLGVREISHLEVLRACMLGETAAPPADAFDAQLRRHPARDTIATLAKLLAQAEAKTKGHASQRRALGSDETLASWCDRVLGTEIDETINREMVKWCEAFLDEGHAPWPMPGREQGFYSAWKFLAATGMVTRWHRQQQAKACAPTGASRGLIARKHRHARHRQRLPSGIFLPSSSGALRLDRFH